MERDSSGNWTGISYDEVKQKAEQIAASLIFTNITPGSAVILTGDSSRPLVLCLLGCLFASVQALIIDSISE